jgi:hypothetical protein
MLNGQRYENYARSSTKSMDALRVVHYDVTPAQARRGRHKQFSSKTHAHTPGQRCLLCKPLPGTRHTTTPQSWRQSATPLLTAVTDK